MEKETWLVVANSSVAHIFKVQKKNALTEVETLTHPASRLRNQDLVSDRPGRDVERMGIRKHSMEQKTSPKDQEFMSFAKAISDYLQNARKEGRFERLYLAANPTLLGFLRDTIPDAIRKLIGGEVDKDMTHMKPNELVNHLPFPL
jgi:protein required for attachment to host cells